MSAPTPPSPPSRHLAAALGLLAAFLPGPAGDARASCGGSDFPFAFTFEAYIDAADDDGFDVDRLRVELPKGSTLLPWDPARYDLEIDRDALEEGSYVTVTGSLRVDGTVLAQAVAAAEPAHEDDGTLSLVSGVIEGIDGDGITVDGHTYPFIDEPDRGPSFLLTADHRLAPEEVRVGDAAAFRLVVDGDSGDTVVADVLLRPSGDGAVLAGRVTENSMEEGGSFFGHDGVWFEVEGVRAFFPWNEDQAIRAVARERPDDSDMLERLAVGDGVRMTGWYRDGVFFLEDLLAAGADSRARPARVLVAEGVVDAADGNSIEVNGVGFGMPEGRRARRIAAEAGIGDRVRVRARVPRDGGEVVARSVRRVRGR